MKQSRQLALTMGTILVSFTLGLFADHVFGIEKTGEKEPVEVYLDLYHQGKVSLMEPFYDKESFFSDPTAEALGTGYSARGKRKIKKKLVEAFAAVQNPAFSPRLEFVSGNYAVSCGVFGYDVPAAQLGRTGDPVRMNLQVATVVEMKEGTVHRHFDYANYEGAMRALTGEQGK